MPQPEDITMMTYIKESPAQIADNVRRRRELTQPLVDAYLAGDFRNIWIVACGSSSNASWCAAPFMRRYLDRDVMVVNSATFLYTSYAPKPDTLCFVVSQSGCSTNSVEALDKLRRMGRPAIGLTGNVEGDFKDHADVLVDWGVGTEVVGYVTKGVATLAEFLMLFALEAGRAQGSVSDAEYDSLVAQLESVPAVHEEVQARTSAFYDLHRRDFLSIRTNYVCGFEQAYGIACEGALKFGETIKIPSFAFEAEEYNHGPNLQLTPAYTLFFVDDLSQGSARMHQLYQAARHVSDHAFFLSGDAAQGDPNVFEIPADRPAEALLEPLYLLPFFQICAYRATDELGTWEENPLLKEAKKYAPSKTENILKVMPLL